MCFLPTTKKKPGTHRLIHPTFIHTVTVTQDNIEEIANVLGIKAAKLSPGATLHIVHETTSKGKGKKR